MNAAIQATKTAVRRVMRVIARWLNIATRGHVTPNAVTIFGFLMHVPIAVLIATAHPLWAALLLVIFGLFDTLDGELSRLQKTSSVRGMLLDASTDRMKEVLLYGGVAYWLAGGAHPLNAVWATVACGASLCVSYVKAKGEAAVASGAKKIPHDVLNHMFKDGVLTFEMRMVVLVLGLVSGYLVWAVAVIAVLASYTAFQRLITISKALDA
ncbi:MAG: CDP-alcohol phosphatidyltransferase family protein [Candidatus Saccharibacteria bacterium]